MNQQEMEAKIKEVFRDEEYVKELLNLETAEEVQASLKEKGIEMTIDEIMKIKNMLEKSEDEELSDEDLEKVGGGCFAIAAGVIVVSLVVTGASAIATNIYMNKRERRW